MARLRLVKIVVQPVFVLDDGDELTEHPVDPISVPAARWPEFAISGFAEATELLRVQVEGS